MNPTFFPELTVVVPTYNERGNIRPLVALLEKALETINWEVVFVDDDSPDGTAREVRALARENPRVRVLHRIGRRGLSGACIEGFLSSIAPIIAVIDADLQHDETLLGPMFAALSQDRDLDLVVGSRNVEDGSAGSGLTAMRKWGSDRANGLARRLLGITVTDPMSGFFMLRRTSFNEIALDLQKQGFKILADMLSASRGRWKVREMPYTFRERHSGTSKMDSTTTVEFLGLLISRLSGGLLPIRFVLFLMVGLSGVVVQLVSVRLALTVPGVTFFWAQIVGVFIAMTTNFILNNKVTYHDRTLRGREFFRGLLSFYLVCSLGAVANVGTAQAIFSVWPNWAVASLFGAIMGALWNFWASLLVTWRAR